MRSGDSFLDQVNETPVTYGVMLLYLTAAFLTDPFSPETDQLIEYGAASGLLVMEGESWRLLSHAFLHGNLVHLLFNSYGLMILGPVLERHMRAWRFILLYVLAGIAGAMTAILMMEEHRPLVGGSGAIFGMLGAILAYNIRGGRTVLDFLENHGSRMLIILIVINLAFGFLMPRVSNAAHIGGLLTGFVLVFCFLDTGRREVVTATGRALQGGWIALFLGAYFYVIFPVLRFDYNLKQFLYTDDPGRRAELRVLLDRYDTFDRLEGLRARLSEAEPRTGIAGVGHREGLRKEYGRVIRRWKARR